MYENCEHIFTTGNKPYCARCLLDKKTIESEAEATESRAPSGQAEFDLLSADLAKTKEKYNELIMAVARKWPGETRHDTALKYIKRAEELTSTCAAKEST